MKFDEVDWDERGPGAETLYGPFGSPRAVRELLEGLAAERAMR